MGHETIESEEMYPGRCIMIDLLMEDDFECPFLDGDYCVASWEDFNICLSYGSI